MLFKSISIRNIRSYKEAKIEFPLGISLFEGDIGSGKSTILMAIEFALFGLGNQRADSLLRKNTLKGSVILEFEVEGKQGKIERTLFRKTINNPVTQDKGLLIFNKAKWQLSPSEMKEKILDILDFKEHPNPRANSYIFRYAVYTPQEEMKQIILQRPESRLQTLRKAFGIEDYKIAAENTHLISRYLKDKINYLAGQTADLAEKQSEIKELKTDRENKQNLFTELTHTGKDIEKEMNRQKEEIQKLQELESQIKEIKAEIPHMIKQIEDKKHLSVQYEQEIKAAEEENQSRFLPIIEKLEKLEKPTNKTQNDLKNRINYIKGKIKKHEAFLANFNLLNEDMRKIQNDLGEDKDKNLDEIQYSKEILISKIEKQNDSINSRLEQIQEISEKIYRLDARKMDIIEKLENLEGLEGSCPICGTLLDSKHKQNLKDEKEKEINKINKEIENLNTSRLNEDKKLETQKFELNHLQNNMEKLEAFIDKISGLKILESRLNSIKRNLKNLNEDIALAIDDYSNFDNIDEYVNHLEKTLEKLKEFERNIENLNNTKYQLEKNLTKIEDNKQMIKVLQTDIVRLENDLTIAKERSDKLNTILNKLNELKSDFKRIEVEFETIKERIVSTKTLIKTLDEVITKLGDEVQKKETLKKQLKSLNEHQNWLNDYFIPTVSLIESHVMNKRLEEFNDNFQKWFNILIDDDTKTARLNEEFTPIVEQDRFEQDMNYLSGGEKTSVALAYRLALNNVVKNVSTGMKSNLLIFDEPTDGFSKEQLYKVREILTELESPQIIIVSHERELESFADNIFRIEKVNGISEVFKIS